MHTRSFLMVIIPVFVAGIVFVQRVEAFNPTYREFVIQMSDYDQDGSYTSTTLVNTLGFDPNFHQGSYSPSPVWFTADFSSLENATNTVWSCFAFVAEDNSGSLDCAVKSFDGWNSFYIYPGQQAGFYPQILNFELKVYDDSQYELNVTDGDGYLQINPYAINFDSSGNTAIETLVRGSNVYLNLVSSSTDSAFTASARNVDQAYPFFNFNQLSTDQTFTFPDQSITLGSGGSSSSSNFMSTTTDQIVGNTFTLFQFLILSGVFFLVAYGVYRFFKH